MTVLLLILVILYLGVMGFWIMKKIDHFIDSGNVHPSWDEHQEKERKQCCLHCSPEKF